MLSIAHIVVLSAPVVKHATHLQAGTNACYEACTQCVSTTSAMSDVLPEFAAKMSLCIPACTGCPNDMCNFGPLADILPQCSVPSFVGVYPEISQTCSFCQAANNLVPDGTAPSPPGSPPAPMPNPPLTPIEMTVPTPPLLVHMVAGWCQPWREIRMVPGDPTQSACIAACDADATCEQAVFEREGPWASECWLGSNLMPNRPNGASRDCSAAAANRGYNGTCVDFCYSKAGWTV